ncbi:MAG: hypothetical protein ACQETI_07260 [Halobacteriota archaeon]
MYVTLVELLAELGAIAFFATGTVVLSGVGIYLEELGLETISAGQTKLGLWIAGMGLMAFYFGPYLMGVTELLPRVRRVLAGGRRPDSS